MNAGLFVIVGIVAIWLVFTGRANKMLDAILNPGDGTTGTMPNTTTGQ
jgi:hypothetical protein